MIDTSPPPPKQQSSTIKSGLEARLASRNKTHTSPTSAIAPGHMQANLIVLPSIYAEDFRLLCQRNPVPCPLLAESLPGSFNKLKSYIPGISDDEVARNLDIRTDIPFYNVYINGQLVKEGVSDIKEEWSSDHIAFLIGCSFSFETALSSAGLTPRHIQLNRNVCMYQTNVPLNPSGVFTGGNYVVSMRPYASSDIEEVRRITRKYTITHGEPMDWGWEAVQRLGIKDVDRPEWGDVPLTRNGRAPFGMKGDENDVPVFWGCGVTPQEAIMKANLKGLVMAHKPGYMLVLDVKV